MSIHHSRTAFSLLMAGALAVAGCQRGDGAKAPSGHVGVNSQAQINPDLQPTLNTAEGQLQFLEQTAQDVLDGHHLTPSQEQALDQGMLDYGTTMKHGFDVAADDGELASDSNGVDGSGESVGIFEAFAEGHVPRVDSFAAKMEQISQGLDNGAITMDEMGLQLSPPGPKAVKFASLRKQRCAGGTLSQLLDKASQTVGDLLIPRAEAMLVLACVPICQSQNWAACKACILAAKPQAIQAFYDFLGCFNSCECQWWKWRTWGCCRHKADCLAEFIRRLA